MRYRSSLLTLIGLLVLAAGWLLSQGAAPATAQTFPDDEIAYINADGRIIITDPRAAAGGLFTWQSPTTGWTEFAVLDANADGSADIVAIGGNTARLLAPRASGASAPTFEQIVAGYTFNWVAVGDVNADAKPDILLQRTITGGNDSVVEIYVNDGSGRTWNRVFQENFGAPWLRIEMGEIDSLAGDEVVMMRNGLPTNPDERIIIRKLAPGGAFVTLFNNQYNWPWFDLAVGNAINQVNGAVAEVVTTRDVIGLETVHFFQYANNNLADAPNAKYKYFPIWHDVALGDVNASGDVEAFFVRDPQVDGGVSLLGRNFGTDTLAAMWTDPGIRIGRNIYEVETGDTDGDGRAEVVVASSTGYRIYVEPASGDSVTTETPASFRLVTSPTRRVAMRLGNFDGDSVVTGPARLAVDKTTMTFTMQRGGANPAAQTFTVSNTGGGGSIGYEVVGGGDWLSMTPFDGNTPTTHTVSVNGAGLAAGTYDKVITVTALDSSVQDRIRQIQVRLVVQALGPALDVQPASLSFSYSYGGVIPAAQTLTIRNIGDGGAKPYNLTVTTEDGGNWLVLSKTSGSTNDTVSVSLSPRDLRPGSYKGNIRVDAGVIDGSPKNIPVTLSIAATGMVVTPASMMIVAESGRPSPRATINIEQSVAGSGAIHWYAYAVLSGDWWDMAEALAQGELSAQAEEGLRFTSPEGENFALSTLPWVRLTPNNGLTPGAMQIELDMATAPVGETRVTILVDGGPETPNRFQGVDVRVLVGRGSAWLPLVTRP